MGGEKLSYTIPTYQALKGILESVYWRPTFIWYIDAMRIMNKVQTESKGIRPIKYSGGNDLSSYTYLRDVRYQVQAHFEWNEHRPELVQDRNEHKHHNIAKRMIERGGRRDVFLGTRECQGYVDPCVFGEGDGFYDQYGQWDMGIMFHGFDYPDEVGSDQMARRFWRALMVDGVVKFTDPRHIPSELRSVIKEMKPKQFESSSGFSEPIKLEPAKVIARAGE